VTIQRVIELTFADEDIRVIAVGDGRQAIERIQADRPDIVLADIGMPERDGYEVAAFVKGQPELEHVPVLLLTGAFEPIDEGRARAAGCDGVLVKPFEPQMVINRVKDLLAGKRPAGLWTAATMVQQPAGPSGQPSRPGAPPAAGADPRGPQGARPSAGGSLEDYFDRLDAAFAELDAPGPKGGAPAPGVQAGGGAGATHASTSADAIAGWDPDLKGDPHRAPARAGAADVPPAEPAHTPAAPHPHAPAAARPSVASAAVADAPTPALTQGASLAEAFAALLAAEKGQAIAPASVRPEDIPDATIDDIVRRVIERMGAEAMRDTVLDVAERLVREEIDRIKRGS
jgi:CheY-like chemotaxis protein